MARRVLAAQLLEYDIHADLRILDVDDHRSSKQFMAMVDMTGPLDHSVHAGCSWPFPQPPHERRLPEGGALDGVDHSHVNVGSDDSG